MTIRVRPARAADAAPLSRFAASTFRETFGPDNTPEDMARYLAAHFDPATQAAEIADPASAILLAEDVGAPGEPELVGYAHLVARQAPATVQGPSPIEIRRFYVASAWHGRGIAHTLMDAAIAAARARGARTVWLAVWERNPRAAAFYARSGFVRVGEQDFVLGNDVQHDWVMARPLEPAPPASRG